MHHLRREKYYLNRYPTWKKQLQSAIYWKQMSFFQQVTSSKYWEANSKQRNVVTKLKNKSVKIYFIDRCAGDPKSNSKRFSNKKKSSIWIKETILSENDVLITKQDEVCDIFNNYFVNVAKIIGNNYIKVDYSIFIY